MRSVKTETKVGIFVIAGLAILAWGTTLVGNFRLGRAEGQSLTAVFNEVSGLEVKSPVRIAGVRVGEVERIYLKDGLAHVAMRLDPGATVREDSQVGIASSGLLGEKYVEITSGSIGKPAVGPGAVLHGADSVSLDRLIAQLTDVAGDIKVMTQSLRGFLGPEGERAPLRELADHFDEMVRNINGLIADNRSGVSRAVRNIGDFAEEARGTLGDNREDVRAAVRNFRDLSADLRDKTRDLSARIAGVVETLDGSVKGMRGDFGGAVGDVRATAKEIETAVASLRRILADVEEGKGTAGKFFREGDLYDNLNRTTTSLGEISEKIRRGEGTLGKLVTDEKAYEGFTETVGSLRRYLQRGERTQLDLGFRGDWLFEPEEVKSAFSLRLSPTPEKFYLLEFVDDPLGRRRTRRTRTTVAGAGGGAATLEVEEERYDDELLLSLLYGRRFGDAVLRAGLIESTGGAGVDWLLAGDRARLSLDAWDFDRPGESPHLALTAAWWLTPHLFLRAGVDDLAEERRRGVFLGGGIRFPDEDLKYALPSLSGLPVGR